MNAEVPSSSGFALQRLAVGSQVGRERLGICCLAHGGVPLVAAGPVGEERSAQREPNDVGRGPVVA